MGSVILAIIEAPRELQEVDQLDQKLAESEAMCHGSQLTASPPV